MDLETLLLPSGIIVTAGGVVAKVITKLYGDMQGEMQRSREDSLKREETLMNYLEQKNETDKVVALALQDLATKMQSMNCRLDNLECEVKEDKQ